MQIPAAADVPIFVSQHLKKTQCRRRSNTRDEDEKLARRERNRRRSCAGPCERGYKNAFVDPLACVQTHMPFTCPIIKSCGPLD